MSKDIIDQPDKVALQTEGIRVSTRLEDIEGRLSKATPGPWEAGSLDGHAADVFTVATEEDLDRWVVCEHAGTDAEFIAHAPADIAYLLAELRKAQDKLTRVEGLADEWEGMAKGTTQYDYALRACSYKVRAAVADATGGERKPMHINMRRSAVTNRYITSEKRGERG